MPLSAYLKIFPYPRNSELLLLYSTKSTALALVPEEVFRQCRKDQAPQDHRNSLMNLGMLVEDQQQEKEQVFQMLPEMNRLNPGVAVSVILGMECNFACRYCYEGSMKGRAAMSDETADQLIAFLKGRFQPGKKKMILDFYGGEPLLYTKRIKHLVHALKPFVEERGGEFQFTLVTNGSLLTRKTAEELTALGLSSVKVTVDGPAENHNRYRPFKSGQGSFDVILKNVRDCCGLVRIAMGGNYKKNNYQSFPSLLDHLESNGIAPDCLTQITFHPVMQINDAFANPEFTGGCASINEPWLVEASLYLQEEILKRSYKTPKLSPSPCMIELDDSFTVHHDGGLYKCVSMIGHPEFVAGDIWSGFTDYSAAYNVANWQDREECRECLYLPLCFGGCRYMLYQRQGTMAGVDCRREFLDATLEQTLLQDLKYRYRA